MRRARGFTLTELAVVAAIVALLLGTLMYTLAAQTEQRNFEDTRRRLETARELLFAYAIVNGRLPCPAVCTGAPACGAGETGTESPVGGATACTAPFGGFLPGTTIGHPNVNAKGFVVDAWGNPIRYAVSAAVPVNSQTPRVCRPVNATTAPVAPHFTNSTNLKANGIDCAPNDLVICASATGINATSCNTAASVTNLNVVAAIVFSTGKNGAIACGTCTDEAANTNADPVFVHHDPRPTGATGGEFDDQMVWIPAGELYARLIAAGVLP